MVVTATETCDGQSAINTSYIYVCVFVGLLCEFKCTFNARIWNVLRLMAVHVDNHRKCVNTVRGGEHRVNKLRETVRMCSFH